MTFLPLHSLLLDVISMSVCVCACVCTLRGQKRTIIGLCIVCAHTETQFKQIFDQWLNISVLKYCTNIKLLFISFLFFLFHDILAVNRNASFSCFHKINLNLFHNSFGEQQYFGCFIHIQSNTSRNLPKRERTQTIVKTYSIK